MISRDQESIITQQQNLRKEGRKNELPNNLKPDQIEEIKGLISKVKILNTKSRREGKLLSKGDYYFYITRDDDTAMIIARKICESEDQCVYYAKLLLNVNEYIIGISKKNIKKIGTLKFKKDTFLVLPYAVPDTYVSEVRTSIPRDVRCAVWDNACNSRINTANCYVCNKLVYNDVSNGWDCSHIVPYITCKKHEIDNLRVCCQSCNRKCGTRQLDDYKDEVSNS